MILSMTGFGRAVAETPTRKITVEIKSLNSKQLDLSTRIPALYREKEIEVRTLVAKKLVRGKVDIYVNIEDSASEQSARINKGVVTAYYNQIKEMSQELGIEVPSDWFQVLLRMPDCMKSEAQNIDEKEGNTLLECVESAIVQLLKFRAQEGEMLRKLFVEKIEAIGQLLTEVEPYEAERIEKVRARIVEQLKKVSEIAYDNNRLEQEMIFYIEKLDVNEEKHRLCNHLKYFVETMEDEEAQGKKLGFIVQEIGREINTLGSKSNHVEMQKIVVKMKDELEQIKEQILNVM